MLAVVLPETMPGPDHATEVFVLTDVTLAKAVVVLQANEPADADEMLMVLVLVDTVKEPRDLQPLEVFVAV